MSIPEATSSGKLALSNLSLRTFWRFAKPWLNFELHQGTASIGGDYQISWADTFSYQVQEGSVSISNLQIDPLDPNTLPDTGTELNSLQVNGITVDGDRQLVEVADVLIDGAGASGWMEGDRISLPELFVLDLPDTPDEEAPAEAETSSEWQARIADIRLTNGNISWRSPFTQPATVIASPISARIQSVNWSLAG